MGRKMHINHEISLEELLHHMYFKEEIIEGIVQAYNDISSQSSELAQEARAFYETAHAFLELEMRERNERKKSMYHTHGTENRMMAEEILLLSTHMPSKELIVKDLRERSMDYFRSYKAA